jgi:hypothetical protein
LQANEASGKKCKKGFLIGQCPNLLKEAMGAVDFFQAEMKKLDNKSMSLDASSGDIDEIDVAAALAVYTVG